MTLFSPLASTQMEFGGFWRERKTSVLLDRLADKVIRTRVSQAVLSYRNCESFLGRNESSTYAVCGWISTWPIIATYAKTSPGLGFGAFDAAGNLQRYLIGSVRKICCFVLVSVCLDISRDSGLKGEGGGKGGVLSFSMTCRTRCLEGDDMSKSSRHE